MNASKQAPPWWVILLGAAAVSSAFLGSRALWEPSETRYALCAREMLISGDFLHPTLHELPHLSKPPLSYWGIAAGLRLFGNGEWGARAYHVPVFVLTALLVGLLGQTLWKTPRGRWSGVVYATMFFPVAASGVLTADTLLAMLETAAVCCLALVWFGARSGHWMILFWVSLGLAFATKGPPALLPLLSIVGFLLLVRPGLSFRWRSLLSFWGIVLFLPTALGWYVFIVAETSGAWSYFVRDELFGRIFSSAHDRNPSFFHVFRLYLPALTVGTLPWLAFWPRLLRQGVSIKAWSGLRDRPAELFLVIWLAAPLGVFSLAQSKLVLYILPLFAPLALMLAKPLALREGPWITLRGMALLCTWVLVLFGFRLTASRIDAPRDSRVQAEFVEELLESSSDRLFSVDHVIHGPDFLLGVRTQNLSIEGGRALDSSKYGKAELVFESLSLQSERHIFLFDGRRRGRIEELLQETGVACEFFVSPNRYHAAVCDPLRGP